MSFIPFRKSKLIPRDNTGKFIEKDFPKSFNKEYTSSLIKYLNCLDPLFRKAQEKSEFQFILSLLRFRGIMPSAHDPYENSLKTVDSIMDLQKKMKGTEKMNIFLWVYGHIIEASEPYETIANMLNILNGQGYNPWNFPKKLIKHGREFINQSPSNKIGVLRQKSSRLGVPEAIFPITDIFDKDLRNAVFHSDYAVSDGEVILSDPSRIYTHQEILKTINKALAYHEVMKNLIKAYTEGYNRSKAIKVSSGFSTDPNEKARLIIRKNHGVVAMKHAWNKKQLSQGKTNWFVGNTMAYEQKYIDKGITVLPPNRVDLVNAIIKFLPNSVRVKVIPYAEGLLMKYG